MRTRTPALRALPLLLLLLCLAPEAKADPILITSGQVSFDNRNVLNNTFSLQGQGVAISGFTRNILGATVFAPGSTFRLERTFVNDPLFPTGSYTAGGVTYNSWLFGSDSLVVEFQTPNAVIPTGTGQQDLVFSAPFTMTGVIFVSTEQSGVLGGVRTTLSGSGTVTFIARRVNSPDPNAPWFPDSLTYTFGPSQPVPEPATMLLLGTGLAAIAARRRLRGRR